MTPGEVTGTPRRRYGRTILGDVLQHPEAFVWSDALYAPPGADLSPSLPVLVWDVDDVDEDTDLPAEAVTSGYDYVLSIQDVQSVVANARDQRPGATLDDLTVALKHYVGTDAFVRWDSTT